MKLTIKNKILYRCPSSVYPSLVMHNRAGPLNTLNYEVCLNTN